MVVLDASTITDIASFQNPIQTSKGVKLVFVNGRIVFKDTDLELPPSSSSLAQLPRPGRVLKCNV